MDQVIECAAKVIGRVTRERPADDVLRAELKEARLPRATSGRVADLVFTYFRWFGWLDARQPLSRRMHDAEILDERLRNDPNSFTDEELRRAVPDWAGQEFSLSRELLLALQARPLIWLRARKGQGTVLAKDLGPARRSKNAEPDANRLSLSDCVEFFGEADLFRLPQFQAGEFEIQDVASQFVGLLCAPNPGETWWDACAGEGGKMLHLSDLMDNKGLIWATDRSDWRLKRLKQRAARAKAFNYRTAAWEGGPKLPTKTKFDGVLVDAPCSGIGTWQRNPHARWTTTLADVRELAEIQKKLVLHAAAAVKPGGRLIYSVCTLARSETDAVAEACSQALSGFEALPLPALPNGQQGASARKWIWPQDFAGNGMFVAAWRRLP